MRRRGLISVFSLLALTSYARAEVPRTTYVEVDASQADVVDPASHSSNIIYLNRCEGGCTLTSGYDDSRQNRSSIIGGTVQISEFGHGDVAWDAVVDCVRAIYEPFDVVITDEDPGDQSHFEAIVAGRPSEIGAGNGVGGVAPFSCGVINNAITYSFANIYGNAQVICEVVAQETAHAFGLDHEYLCEDPMTYLRGCGAKSFQDVDAQCGEFQARQCSCGASTQNSVQSLLAVFGPSDPVPPTVEIVRPEEGQKVDPGFPIEVRATDDVSVEKVEFYVNSQKIGEAGLQPYVFNAPAAVSDGRLIVEARAVDNRGAVGTARVEVLQGAPCNKGGCANAEVCVDGRCVPGPGSPGGLGEPCDGDGDCASRICGADSEGTQLCAEECKPGSGGCPGGFNCVKAGDSSGVCWPGESGGGCSATGHGAPKAPLALALFLGALVLARRRRRG